VQYPFEHYLAILCLESHREGVAIVGENLGIVPAEVDEALAAHDLLGTWVAYGAMDGTRYGRAFAGPEPWVLATVNTHDMPTFRGFVAGSDLDIRFELGLIDGPQLATLRAERADDIRATAASLRDDGWLDLDEPDPCDRDDRDEPDPLYRAMLRSLAASAAPVVLANLEDLWAETEQQNVPGTTVERPNWRRLTRRRVDALDDDPAVAAVFAQAHRVVSPPP